jgi:hypothetical protein
MDNEPQSVEPLTQSIEAAWNEFLQPSLFAAPELPWHIIEVLHVREILQALLTDSSLSIGSFVFDYDQTAEMLLQSKSLDCLEARCTALFIDWATPPSSS